MLPRSCFFLSSNFFVKATLRNWKKNKNWWMVTVTFFFVSCPTKHLFDIQRLDSAFLKYSFAPPRLMGSDKPCWCIMFHGHLFLFLLFGQTCLEKVVTNNNHAKFFFDTKTRPFCSKPLFSSVPNKRYPDTNVFFCRYLLTLLESWLNSNQPCDFFFQKLLDYDKLGNFSFWNY